jgi:hypothetical protein
MKKIILALSLLNMCVSYAQQSTSFEIAKAGESDPYNTSPDYNPVLRVVEMPAVAGKSELQRVKDTLELLYPKKTFTSGNSVNQRSSSVPAPTVGRTFAGNLFNNSTPNDNEIAIGNNGSLASVQNSSIFRYRTWNNTTAGTATLSFWSSSLGNPATKYDPKVIYDPQSNRFILLCLAGYSSGQTGIIVGFSKTDTVNGAWNLYQLPGNPFADTAWTDYPMLTVNEQEVFITVNLVYDNMPWQTGFAQTLIWQINKWDGYAGNTLSSQLHSGIQHGGRPIRNLCPVEGGDQPPSARGLYFLSNRNMTLGNDTIFLVHITDSINAPGQQVTVTPLISPVQYIVPPNSTQPTATGLLQTNDARILGAFIQNDKIQFVSNTLDTTTGFCTVYHGMINDPDGSPAVTAAIITDTLLEYGYPNIAWAGYNGNDDKSMIVFLHSSQDTFPGFSVRVADGIGNYSDRVVIKRGLGYINVLNGTDRWGDYSGIQRRYNQQGTFWVNGMIGSANNLHQTWIGEVALSPDVSVPSTPEVQNDAGVFPNPTTDQFTVQFRIEEAVTMRIIVYDINGKEVTVLLQDRARAGLNQFWFNTQPLQNGVYLIRGEAVDGKVLFTQRLVKQ